MEIVIATIIVVVNTRKYSPAAVTVKRPEKLTKKNIFVNNFQSTNVIKPSFMHKPITYK
jgi:hypothetical protein